MDSLTSEGGMGARLFRSASQPLLRTFGGGSWSVESLGGRTTEALEGVALNPPVWNKFGRSDVPSLDTFDVEEANALKSEMRAAAAARRIELAAAKLEKSTQELAEQCNIGRSAVTPVADTFGQRENCPCKDFGHGSRCMVGHGVRPLSLAFRAEDLNFQRPDLTKRTLLQAQQRRPASCCVLSTDATVCKIPEIQQFQLKPISCCSTIRLWSDGSGNNTSSSEDGSTLSLEEKGGIEVQKERSLENGPNEGSNRIMFGKRWKTKCAADHPSSAPNGNHKASVDEPRRKSSNSRPNPLDPTVSENDRVTNQPTKQCRTTHCIGLMNNSPKTMDSNDAVPESWPKLPNQTNQETKTRQNIASLFDVFNRRKRPEDLPREQESDQQPRSSKKSRTLKMLKRVFCRNTGA